MSQKTETQKDTALIARPPIVVVMGHIDHGKTTLLDYIRKAGVAAKESGGITQHVGAYEAEFRGKRITFLDTPGHEAFSKMRSRGARVADIAILVVAADDSVKPQTKEALSAILIAKIPYLVAINKIDKPTANLERTKSDLAEAGVFLEGRGGNVPYVEISAKEGERVDQLLEAVLLLAELEELKSNRDVMATGVVIESHMDQKRGIAATLLLRDGVLKKGEYVAAGSALSKVKIFEDFTGKLINEARASQPVRIVGFDKLPDVGAEFLAFTTQKEATGFVLSTNSNFKAPKKSDFFPGGIGENEISLGIIIKTDVLGSSEAVEHEIAKLKSDRIDFKILRSEAGDITEDDVKLASSLEGARSFIFGFKVKVRGEVLELAEKFGVEIATFDIIYEISDFLKKKMDEIAPPKKENKILGRAKIVKIFGTKGKSQIIGGRVFDGKLKRGASFQLFRREQKISDGKIENLQSGKIDMPEIASGSDFGALIQSKVSAAAGDIIECIE